jgi:hypothetical protein
MPISTNAPFNEFGQSQILRDIEQLYLALNGAGSGGPGDGQTQDQTAVTSQESGGVPDLSGLATVGYVDQSIAAIPTPSLYSVGGLFLHSRRSAYTSGSNTFVVPDGVNTIMVDIIGGGGGGGYTTISPTDLLVDSGGVANVYHIAQGAVAQQGGMAGRLIICMAVTPGESFSFTIGASGTAGTGGGNDGTTGGDTTITEVSSGNIIATAGGGGGGKATQGVSTSNAGGKAFYSPTYLSRAFWAVPFQGATGASALLSTLTSGVGVGPSLSQPQLTGYVPLGTDGTTLYGGGGTGRIVQAGSAAVAPAAGGAGYAAVYY